MNEHTRLANLHRKQNEKEKDRRITQKLLPHWLNWKCWILNLNFASKQLPTYGKDDRRKKAQNEWTEGDRWWLWTLTMLFLPMKILQLTNTLYFFFFILFNIHICMLRQKVQALMACHAANANLPKKETGGFGGDGIYMLSRNSKHFSLLKEGLAPGIKLKGQTTNCG